MTPDRSVRMALKVCTYRGTEEYVMGGKTALKLYRAQHRTFRRGAGGMSDLPKYIMKAKHQTGPLHRIWMALQKLYDAEWRLRGYKEAP